MSTEPRRGALLPALAGLLLLFGCGGSEPEAEAPEQAAAETTQVVSTDGALQVKLFFPGQNALLHPEMREVEPATELSERVEAIVQLLLAGPESRVLRAPLPSGVGLLGVYVDAAAGVAWVDLSTGEEGIEGGSKRELLSVYSLVDSIIENVEEIDRVGLLWNGNQETTFAGHVDTTRPLSANRSWIAR